MSAQLEKISQTGVSVRYILVAYWTLMVSSCYSAHSFQSFVLLDSVSVVSTQWKSSGIVSLFASVFLINLQTNTFAIQHACLFSCFNLDRRLKYGKGNYVYKCTRQGLCFTKQILEI